MKVIDEGWVVVNNLSGNFITNQNTRSAKVYLTKANAEYKMNSLNTAQSGSAWEVKPIYIVLGEDDDKNVQIPF